MAKTIRARNEHQQAIVRLIDGMSGKYSKWAIWNDFITLVATSIANVMPNSQYDKREEMYMNVAQKYTPDELMQFVKMRDEIVAGLEDNPDQDFLGELFMALDMGNEWVGQFFTPYCVGRMMSEVSTNIDVLKATIKNKGFVSVNDPACGAGGLLVAFANVCRQHDINFQWSVLFVAQDIDMLAAMMCYIQLSLLGCPGYVVIGDTLAHPAVCRDHRNLVPADETNVWYTPMFYSDLWQGRQICARMDVLTQRTRAKAEQKPTQAEQKPAKTEQKPVFVSAPVPASAPNATPTQLSFF